MEIRKARKGPINGRIRFLCRLMAGGRYHILRTCPHTRDALMTARYGMRATPRRRSPGRRHHQHRQSWTRWNIPLSPSWKI
jgi:hypothetical protein